MEKSWATSGPGDGSDPTGPTDPDGPGHGGAWSVDLHLDALGKGPRSGVRRGLTDALRDAVRGGRLAPGTRLPSSRTLAADLGVARNTVADAYADLVAEGWLTARQGSGTRVADRAVPRPVASARPPRASGAPVHDLTPGTPDVASFPRGEWLKAARRALAAAPNDALGYGDPRGRIELRTALAAYLARARGVHAEPDRIVVVPGFVHGLTLLGELLGARGLRQIAVEPYGLGLHRDRLARVGLRTRPLGLDGLGTRTDGLAGHRAVLMTPAHQFPIGVPLHPDRRARAVEWARRVDGLILEDDYDGEFRYDRQPVGALQGLDPDRVVYLGTASKSLAPGLRIAWMVLPAALAPEVAGLKERAGASGGAVDQLTLAEFLTSGAYDRHVRSVRIRYRRRRDQLVAALAERAPEVRVTGIAAGLHAVLELPPGTEQVVVQSASWQRLAVQGLSRFRHPDAVTAPRDALVVGYGTPTDHTWPAALEALCRSLP
ncbi:PLP-dependent aminotransferase family protein [Streptomyces sp. NRRL B-1347]|uniref:MocR-like pyridoxine biosynthesis transcription factor PdxR n=1 Tax=Streptomyces sp. NRRL B-1347 TaxID=1476877 RepID=UPI00099D2F4C|nr:PLP-dependent aminotransferase family protein [Streptomyces sp. NRRL B-1347]